MTRSRKTLLAALGCAVVTSVVWAQDAAPEPELYFIIKEHVEPAKTQAYEAGIKDLIDDFVKHDLDPAKVGWHVVSGPEMGYVFVMPLEDFGTMKTLQANWMEAIETVGQENFESLMAETNDAITKVARFHVARRPDLSYAPSHASLGQEDVKYIGYTFVYAKPGSEKKLEKLFVKYAALYKKHNIDVGWSVYESITGDDLPLYVFARAAKSQADYHVTAERLEGTLGDAGKAIGAEAMKHVRRIEMKGASPRPDLSFTPETKIASAD